MNERTFKRILFGLAVWFWFGYLAFGSTYYVSTTGGTGAGTLGDPWSLAHALSTVTAGNTLVFLPGTYPPFQATQPSTVFQSQTKWAAKVVGGASGTWPILIYNAAKTNCTVDGFEVTGGNDRDGIGVQADYCTVRNCWVHNNGTNGSSLANGIAAKVQNGTTIERNLIEFNGSAGIYASGTNITIDGNVTRNQLIGINIYAGQPRTRPTCSYSTI